MKSALNVPLCNMPRVEVAHCLMGDAPEMVLIAGSIIVNALEHILGHREESAGLSLGGNVSSRRLLGRASGSQTLIITSDPCIVFNSAARTGQT